MLTTSQHIENLNYYRDARTQGEVSKPVLYINDESIELPTRWIVCPVCEGRGTHVNPAIDAGGLSPEQFTDDEFAEAYFGGTYDVTCNYCKGRTTVPSVDWNALSPEQADAYRAQLNDLAEMQATERAERMMGA